MKSTRIGLAAIVLSSATMMSACQDSQGGSEAASSSKASSTTSSQSSSSSTSGSAGSSDAAGSTSDTTGPSDSSGSSSSSDPSGARPKAPQNVSVPGGTPLTDAKVVLAGGYRSDASSHYAKLYSVWEVDGTGPGVATISYELLDASGKVLATHDDTINVGSGRRMTKVSNTVGEAPAGTKTVRMRLTKVDADEHANDISISDVLVTPDAYEGHWPKITGRYSAGRGNVYGLSAVCYEEQTGRVVIGNGLVDGGDTAKRSGTFTVNMGAAPAHWHPTNCYVGESGHMS